MKSTPGPAARDAPVLQIHPVRGRQALAVELLAACIEDAARLGYRRLAIVGEAPLSYRALPGLLSRARGVGMTTSVASRSGLTAHARWPRIAPLIDRLVVAIDGTPSEHDASHRRDGAFGDMIRELELLRGHAAGFEVVFTLTQHNIDSLDFVAHLAARYGARGLKVQPLIRQRGDHDGDRPDGLELLFALLEAERLTRELGIVIDVDAVSSEQLAERRAQLVPALPAVQLAVLAPRLIVDAGAMVQPLTGELDPRFALGSLETGRLCQLAHDWLRDGWGDALVEAYARTYDELIATRDLNAADWYGEVAARTRRAEFARQPLALQACG